MNHLGARIEPLRALLYDQRIVRDLARVLAPPYDVISEAQQRDLYERSPYNVVRLELGRDADRYAAAQATLREWVDGGVLRRAERPSLFLYTQRFPAEGRNFVRTGFVVRFRLEDFARGRVLPHEKTFPAPKEDRFKLLAATRTNISSIFGLYSGSHPELDRVRGEVMSRAPLVEADDSLGIRNELRAIAAPDEIATVQSALESARVLIADGHHRYETALSYRTERRANEHPSDPQGFDYTMMTLVACADPGLVILPTHRIVRRFRPQAMASFAAQAREAFEVSEVDDRVALRSGLAAGGHGTIGIALAGAQRFFLVRLRDPDTTARVIPEAPTEVRTLDVTVLHTLIFDQIFSLKAAEIRKGGNLEYTIDANAALDAVRDGRADGAFLVNPPSITDVERASDAGATMPEKSTYFFPKLVTGLVLNPLDD
ncbi:MAG TPA: DUF1015 domain-containing protein [Candidatus Binataceae bacterium]|nr:DUF1015 domain-containing protein [Candidatus Binataceae bacterium]